MNLQEIYRIPQETLGESIGFLVKSMGNLWISQGIPGMS